jgi:hypothetical protein
VPIIGICFCVPTWVSPKSFGQFFVAPIFSESTGHDEEQTCRF